MNETLCNVIIVEGGGIGPTNATGALIDEKVVKEMEMGTRIGIETTDSPSHNSSNIRKSRR